MLLFIIINIIKLKIIYSMATVRLKPASSVLLLDAEWHELYQTVTTHWALYSTVVKWCTTNDADVRVVGSSHTGAME